MSLSPRAAFIILCACLLCSAANVSARKSLRQPQDALTTPAASVDGAELLAGTSPEQAAVEPTVDATASLQPLSVTAEAVVPELATPIVPAELAPAPAADLVDATSAGDAAAQPEPAPAATAAAATTGTNNFDVIVVGAGLAGLKAAVDLAAKNYKVLVLEGRNRVGGRVWSAKPSATATYSLEVGAQWLHGDGRSNDMYTFWTTTMGAASQVRCCLPNESGGEQWWGVDEVPCAPGCGPGPFSGGLTGANITGLCLCVLTGHLNGRQQQRAHQHQRHCAGRHRLFQHVGGGGGCGRDAGCACGRGASGQHGWCALLMGCPTGLAGRMSAWLWSAAGRRLSCTACCAQAPAMR